MADRPGAVKPPPRLRRCVRIAVAVGLLRALWTPDAAGARTLEEVLIAAFPGELRTDAEGFAHVFARTVAASFPVTGASSPYVYRFDPTSDSFQRASIPLGPVFSERAETVGPHKLSLGLNYLFADYAALGGHELGALVSHDPSSPGSYLVVCAGVCEPVQGNAHLDLEAQVLALSATYGLMPDLDINLVVPLVRTSVRASTIFTGPDPRVPPQPGYFPYASRANLSEASAGVGDMLFRLKYILTHSAPVDVAGGFTLSLPTGSRADFHGTGDTLVGAGLYASRTYAERIEPHFNLSFVVNADKFDRSQARYSAGVDARLLEWLTLNNDVLGRSDIAQADAIDRPAFLQIERTDALQFSTGIKIAPGAHTAVFFNALLPLNDGGLRADRILTLGIERVF